MPHAAPPTKLIHLTDPHFVAPGEALFGLDPAGRLASVIETINRDHADAAACIVTGDLTDVGDPRAYVLLRDYLSGLCIPYLLALGNHDLRAAFADAFPDTQRDRFGFVQSLHSLGGLDVLVLDTLVEGRDVGALDAGRLNSLEELLGTSRRPVVVACHHPPGSVGIDHFRASPLVNGDAVLDRLVAHGGVLQILCGHVHVDVSGSWRGIPFSANPGTAHHIIPDLARLGALFTVGRPCFSVLQLGDGVAVHRFSAGGPLPEIATCPEERMTPYAIVPEPTLAA